MPALRKSLLKKVLLRNTRRRQRRLGLVHPLKKHLPFLRRLTRASQNGGKLTKVLKKAKASEYKALYNTFYNLLRGNINLPEEKRLYVKQHKNFIRSIASKKGLHKNKKKKLIKQVGGFLPGLIGALIPTLISTISALTR